MMTATEARELTNTYNEKVAEQHQKALAYFMERDVFPAIELEANQGKEFCRVTGSCLFTADEIVDYLVKLGYVVEAPSCGRGIFTIGW